MSWPQSHHVAAALQELGPECRLTAERLRIRLRSADMLYRSVKACGDEVPGVTEVKDTYAREMSAINAMRKALAMPSCPLSPALRAVAMDETDAREADAIEAQAEGLAKAWLMNSVSGPRNTEGERALVQHLGETFFLATGKRPTVNENKSKHVKDQEVEAFTGRFMRFLRVVLPMMKVTITGGSVAKAVSQPNYRRRFLEQENCGGYPAAAPVDIETVTHNDGVTDEDTRDHGGPDSGGR